MTEIKKQEKDNSIQQKGAMGLAILGILPILFFGTAMEIVGAWLHNPVFATGVIISMLSGILKVVWKLVRITKHKDLSWANRQFRILMPAGLLLVIVGILSEWHHLSTEGIFSLVLDSPFRFLFLAGILVLALMLLIAVVRNRKQEKYNLGSWVATGLNALAQFLILLGVICFLYVSDYYRAGDVAGQIDTELTEASDGALLLPAEDGQEDVILTRDGDRLIFTPQGEITAGMIFYPGGKVEYTAYIPLLRACAQKGILCILIQMPDNLAVLDMDAADGIPEEYPEVTDWYLAGHSLGGAMAASYISGQTDKYCGLILMGAYSTADLSDSGLSVLSIYGSQDGVLSREKYEADRDNLPADFTEYIIEGGCHSYFGDYGMQEGDGTPSVTAEEQWEITAGEIAAMVDEKSAEQ